MRVLQLHNIQLGSGGADLVLDREQSLLLANGHQVQRFVVDNRSLSSMSQLTAARKSVWNSEAANALQTQIAKFQPDVVHVHTPFPLMSPLVIRRAKQLGCSVVQTCHSFRNFCANGLFLRNGRVCTDCNARRIKWPAILHRCYKSSLAASMTMATSLTLHSALGTFSRDVDVFIALTEFARSKILQEGIEARKVVVKQNFLSEPPTPGAGGGGYALFVGRLEPEKGIRTLLKAWAGTQAPDLRLRILGNGSLRGLVEATAQQSAQIEYLGARSQAEVIEQLRDAEFLVFPSEWYEAGFTLVMIEALACGCPILASDIGNFSEAMIVGETGLLFRCGDPQELARQASELVSSPDRLAAMRTHCRRHFEADYTAEANYPRLIQVYEQALREARA